MVTVKHLTWDDENRDHIAQHNVTPEEIREVCEGSYKATESYRKRILIVGKTKTGRILAIVLSPEDKNLQPYGEGMYYVITSFEKGEMYERNRKKSTKKT